MDQYSKQEPSEQDDHPEHTAKASPILSLLILFSKYEAIELIKLTFWDKTKKNTNYSGVQQEQFPASEHIEYTSTLPPAAKWIPQSCSGFGYIIPLATRNMVNIPWIKHVNINCKVSKSAVAEWHCRRNTSLSKFVDRKKLRAQKYPIGSTPGKLLKLSPKIMHNKDFKESSKTGRR